MRILRDVLPAESLRTVQCAHCGGTSDPCDDELVLNPKCHPTAGTNVTYTKAVHALIITCRKCSASVITIKLPDLQ